jgi:site-specific recombinase XerD
MFDQLFRRRAAVRRHLNSPLSQERLEYLQYCAKQGYRVSTLRTLASDLLEIQNLLGLATSSEFIGVEAVQAAVDQRLWPRLRHSNHIDGQQRRECLLFCAIRWLRFMKRLRPPSVPLPVYQPLKEDFADYLRVERNLSAETIRTRCGRVEDFLRWFFRNHESLRQLTIADLDEAIARKGRDDGYARSSTQGYASDLRTFVRYAESKGWCSPGSAAGVVAPRVYRGERLPRGPFWNDVQRLIATTEGDQPQDLRGRAVTLLLSVYALRSGEVRALRLDDVDWERNLLFIPRTKGRRTEAYPLSPTVGEAIVRYLQEARPRSSYREIFLTVEAPIRPLSGAAIWRIVAKRARALDPPVVPHGAHALRHACATHLLEQGLSLKEIGDHLGHRALSSTARYASVNLTGLREVANLSLGGLL